MSFAELMQHAREIQQKAKLKAIQQWQRRMALLSINQSSTSPYPIPKNIVDGIEREFSDIPNLFAPFTEMPTPESFEEPINNLERAVAKLAQGDSQHDPITGITYVGNVELAKMSGAASYIEDWTGRAAMEFKSTFIDPFPTIVHNQFLVANVLRAALQAEREIWVNARKDIDKIAHDVLEALDRMDDCGKNEWTMTFTVAAAVATVAAVPLTGGAALAVTAVAAGSAAAATMIGTEAPPTIRFSGESASAVVSQMRMAISKLTEYIIEQESKIAQAMAATHKVLAGERKNVVFPRPALADATRGNITSPEFMGYSR